MINGIKENSKLNVHWKVSPYDYSKEMEENIARRIAKKYGLKVERVKVVPDFFVNDNDEELSIGKDVIGDIQDKSFQVELFKEYIKLNDIKDVDFEGILKIDSEINAIAEIDDYTPHKRYSIKWIKWDNFLSYGEDNFFDFTKLKGLTLLSGEPANQSGKTTFAIDLLHFLLFGRTSKAATQDKIFNKHIPEATSVVVEGCIEVDGEDYVIKRVLSRPALNKRSDKSKTTQKVEYYRIVGGKEEELEDYIDEQQEENSVKTNKLIKEAIGNESDFDLIMSVTESTLDDLVNKKDTERGRLLARWIGLLPLEKKEEAAREKFNSDVKPYLVMNQYNEEKMRQENEAFNMTIQEITNSTEKILKENDALLNEISSLEEARKALMASKQSVDDNLMKLDITTFENKMNKCIEDGKMKASEINDINNELKEIGDVEFSVEEYDKTSKKLSDSNSRLSSLGTEYRMLEANAKRLKTSEICPTCGRKLDNVDNSSLIKQTESDMTRIVEDGKTIKNEVAVLQKQLEDMKSNHEKYDRKSKLSMKKAALEVNVAELRNKYVDYKRTKEEYDKNKAAIDKNNELDIAIRNNEALINSKRTTRENNLSIIAENNSSIEKYKEQIRTREELIEKIKEEQQLVKNWKLYIELVGKNGVSKMVLRKALPIINARLREMLSDVCDFTVEVMINNRNDVTFSLIKDGVRSDLSSGSGFELTASALALRAVLADMSTITRCSILILDEIWGRVAKANHENMRNLIEKISKDYTSVFLITHLDEVKDWCNTNIVVKKENNVSRIVTAA